LKYIGSKSRLLSFIYSSLLKVCNIKKGIFCDIFSGTAVVGNFFKEKNFKIISNDFMYYSYLQQYSLIKLNYTPTFDGLRSIKKIKFHKDLNQTYKNILYFLNNLKGKKGYFFDNYAPSGKFNRKYFTDDNAKIIDSIRDLLLDWFLLKKINKEEYYLLLSNLINAADHVANISGTYGAYLKIWRPTALKKIYLKDLKFYNNFKNNLVFNEDSNLLIKKIRGDIIYIDPPYNSRQYAPNFHVLESLAVWDKQELKGKTGLRNYENQKSNFSIKKKCSEALTDLINNAKFKYIILSYNNEGLIPFDKILEILSCRGKLHQFKLNYRRFRTERNHEKRQYKDVDDKVIENLFIVEVKKN
jgi:adenine-specific DNA-methyltransferase